MSSLKRKHDDDKKEIARAMEHSITHTGRQRAHSLIGFHSVSPIPSHLEHVQALGTRFEDSHRASIHTPGKDKAKVGKARTQRPAKPTSAKNLMGRSFTLRPLLPSTMTDAEEAEFITAAAHELFGDLDRASVEWGPMDIDKVLKQIEDENELDMGLLYQLMDEKPPRYDDGSWLWQKRPSSTHATPNNITIKF